MNRTYIVIARYNAVTTNNKIQVKHEQPLAILVIVNLTFSRPGQRYLVLFTRLRAIFSLNLPDGRLVPISRFFFPKRSFSCRFRALPFPRGASHICVVSSGCFLITPTQLFPLFLFVMFTYSANRASCWCATLNPRRPLCRKCIHSASGNYERKNGTESNLECKRFNLLKMQGYIMIGWFLLANVVSSSRTFFKWNRLIWWCFFMKNFLYHIIFLKNVYDCIISLIS